MFWRHRGALAITAVLCLGGVSAASADDESHGAHAFIELIAPRVTYYVNEPIRLRVRFGIDAEFFRTKAIPLFRQHLDVPVRIDAPWIRALCGTIALFDTEPVLGQERLTFALNDGASQAQRLDDRVVDGRTFTVLEIERSYLPQRAGDIAITAPALRFAYASRFDEDLLQGRVAADRHEACAAGNSLALHVGALPEAGRPDDFAGAVGRFAIEASGPSEAIAGEPFRLTLHIDGEGNLETFDPPRLDGLARFHVFGVTDDRRRPRRTVTYDIAALGEDVMQIPAIRLAYFDTTAPVGYRVAATPPVSLVVRLSPKDAANRRPADEATAEPPESNAAGAWIATALAAAIAVAAYVTRRRRRALAHARIDTGPVRAAAEALRATADPAGAFAAFLGACLRVPQAAVMAPDLASRLTAAGVPADLAARTAATLDGLVAARYGGGAPDGVARAAVLALAEELERVFGRAPVPADGAAGRN